MIKLEFKVRILPLIMNLPALRPVPVFKELWHMAILPGHPVSNRSPLIALIMVLGLLAAHAEPFAPTDGNQVLERLRAKPFDPATQHLHELRARLATDPANPTVACEFARQCIELSRSEANPRYLGRAQGALARWWDQPTPPVDVLVLRATIKQSQHDFTNSLADLNLALKLDPANAQAWLTKATVLTVLGDYDAARRACAPLIQLTPGLIGLTAAVSVSSLNGQAASSCRLLSQALAGQPNAGIGDKLWALTVLAEGSARLGRLTEAEDYFKRALALGEHDPYLLGAYADLLLDEGRDREVVTLLAGEVNADALLLRLALAESRLVPPPDSYPAHLASLQARFEAGHLRGDFVHQREEARYALELLHQPSAALKLAQANWRVQREPADVRILLEAARAAGDAAAAQPALAFIKEKKLEDVQLDKLARQITVASAKSPIL
jgi:tetratricopeptide (TPR) repeat protein